jgi:hypothetical protein
MFANYSRKLALLWPSTILPCWVIILFEPSLPLISMVLTSFRIRLTLTVFHLPTVLRVSYFRLLNVNSSYFTLVTWLNGRLSKAL